MMCRMCPFLKFVCANGNGWTEPQCALGGAMLDEEDLDIKQHCIADTLQQKAKKRASDGTLEEIPFSPLEQHAMRNAYGQVPRATYHLASLLNVNPMDVSHFARHSGLIRSRQHSPTWKPTATELEVVKRLYPAMGPTGLAARLGVTVAQLIRRARQLGLVKPAQRRWTAQERAELVRLSSQMSSHELAARLGRTPTALLLKRKRCQIKCRQGWQLRDVCALVGYDHHDVRRAIRRGRLKGVRVHYQDGVRGWWHFTSHAVADFLLRWERTDPLRVDLRSLDKLMNEVSTPLQRQLAALREKVADVVRYQVVGNHKCHKVHVVKRLRRQGFAVYHYNGVIATPAQPSDVRALFTHKVYERLRCVTPTATNREKLSIRQSEEVTP